ncbi:MAG: cobalamin biosynthesis protein CobD, partial [Thermodesulfovibrionia bacterium]|nr:cobalamin biosynthesis protein CobD [Thermodesulfovibrionia bacterium]
EMMEHAALLLAYALDSLIGGTKRVLHPVRGMGWAIEKTEEMLREVIPGSSGVTGLRQKKYPRIQALFQAVRGRLSPDAWEKLAGVILAVTISGLTYFIFHLVSRILLEAMLETYISYLLLACYVYLVSTTIASRELLRSCKVVMDEAGKENIEDARNRLGMIVGRDTEGLDRKDILKAVMETISENASDGIVAPMFYFALGGLPLAMAYKAVNTLDSMVGYKNEKYKSFGWASAKLDDAANYIPARITGFLIIAAAFSMSFFRLTVSEFSRWYKKAGNGPKLDIIEPLKNIKQNFTKAHFMGGINAFRIMRSDGAKHSSPNSGIPEAAIAGALGVRLGGPSTYRGVFVNKPYIGEEEQDEEGFYLKASEEAMKIIKITSLLGLITALGILFVRTAIWG